MERFKDEPYNDHPHMHHHQAATAIPTLDIPLQLLHVTDSLEYITAMSGIAKSSVSGTRKTSPHPPSFSFSVVVVSTLSILCVRVHRVSRPHLEWKIYRPSLMKVNIQNLAPCFRYELELFLQPPNIQSSAGEKSKKRKKRRTNSNNRSQLRYVIPTHHTSSEKSKLVHLQFLLQKDMFKQTRHYSSQVIIDQPEVEQMLRTLLHSHVPSQEIEEDTRIVFHEEVDSVSEQIRAAEATERQTPSVSTTDQAIKDIEEAHRDKELTPPSSVDAARSETDKNLKMPSRLKNLSRISLSPVFSQVEKVKQRQEQQRHTPTAPVE